VSAWYVETSAFVKLVRDEEHTEALRHWVRERETAGDALVSSDLLRTEAIRVARRVEDDAVLERAVALIDNLVLVRLVPERYDAAGYLGPPPMRSLEALHLAAAVELGGDLAGIASYDERLIQAAASINLTTVSPGRERPSTVRD
jgi:predicted nucleic acid-binding protein